MPTGLLDNVARPNGEWRNTARKGASTHNLADYTAKVGKLANSTQ